MITTSSPNRGSLGLGARRKGTAQFAATLIFLALTLFSVQWASAAQRADDGCGPDIAFTGMIDPFQLLARSGLQPGAQPDCDADGVAPAATPVVRATPTPTVSAPFGLGESEGGESFQADPRPAEPTFVPVLDRDGDGFAGISSGGRDCDDADPGVNPAATDIPDNGIDEDCDGTDATVSRVGCIIGETAVVTILTQSECDGLVDLYVATNGPNWFNDGFDIAGWGTATDPCGWYGVACSATQLFNLNLEDTGLVGAVPASIGSLTNLLDLDMSGNDLTALPAELGNLTKLVSLDLSDNELTAVPSEIGNLTNIADVGR